MSAVERDCQVRLDVKSAAFQAAGWMAVCMAISRSCYFILLIRMAPVLAVGLGVLKTCHLLDNGRNGLPAWNPLYQCSRIDCGD
jgi:hypothetical protein